MNEEMYCILCHGRGLDSHDRTCPRCHGTGYEPTELSAGDTKTRINREPYETVPCHC